MRFKLFEGRADAPVVAIVAEAELRSSDEIPIRFFLHRDLLSKSLFQNRSEGNSMGTGIAFRRFQGRRYDVFASLPFVPEDSREDAEFVHEPALLQEMKSGVQERISLILRSSAPEIEYGARDGAGSNIHCSRCGNSFSRDVMIRS